MKLEITTSAGVTTVELDALAEKYSHIVTIGRKCKEVWNSIAIEDESVDQFQCYIMGAPGAWKLNHGQERTECPKGLMSSKLVPCNGCLGRCVNLSPGRPKYYLRTPDTPTLLNGSPVSEWGSNITEGDVVTFGNVTIKLQ